MIVSDTVFYKIKFINRITEIDGTADGSVFIVYQIILAGTVVIIVNRCSHTDPVNGKVRIPQGGGVSSVRLGPVPFDFTFHTGTEDIIL